MYTDKQGHHDSELNEHVPTFLKTPINSSTWAENTFKVIIIVTIESSVTILISYQQGIKNDFISWT